MGGGWHSENCLEKTKYERLLFLQASLNHGEIKADESQPEEKADKMPGIKKEVQNILKPAPCIKNCLH